MLLPCNSHGTLQAMSALQVMSVGWNPFFKNESKTCEPWLLHDFDTDFYDKELRCGFSWCSSEGLIATVCCLACEVLSVARLTEKLPTCIYFEAI